MEGDLECSFWKKKVAACVLKRGARGPPSTPAMEVAREVERDARGNDVKSLGCAALSSQDWSLIEAVSVQTRQVGQMMQREGEALAAPAPARDDSRPHLDVCSYRELCCHFSLPTCCAPRAPTQKKSAVRAQLERQAFQRHVENIEKLQAGFPRMDRKQWEGFVVAFRAWARAPPPRGAEAPADACDKMASCANLIKVLESYAEVARDLEEDVDAVSARFAFPALLAVVAERESLLVSPRFTSAQIAMQLYPEQRQVAVAVLSCLQDRAAALAEGRTPPALLLRYCTPPSTGKSSAAAYIGAMFAKFRKLHVKMQQTYVIYECYSESVRLDVAKTCVAACVPFAIFSNCVACPSYMCYYRKAPKKAPPSSTQEDRLAQSLKLLDACDIRPAVLVADPVSAVFFLEHRRSAQQSALGDVLLFDEPTGGVSEAIAAAHASILVRAPAVTVLMGATCPPLENLPASVEHINSGFNGAVRLVEVCSSRIASPCTVVDAEGRAYAPHRLFHGTCAELSALLTAHLHLKRLYSPRAVLQLLGDLKDQEAAASFIDSRPARHACCFDHIRQVALDALALCLASLRLGVDCEEYGLVCIDTACTAGAHKLGGTSLFLSEETDLFLEVALPPLLENAEKLSRRLQLQRAEQQRLSRLKVHENSAKQKSKERDSRLGRLQAQDALESSFERAPLWPAELCVNSPEHRARFAKGVPYDSALGRSVPLLPEALLQSSCEALVEGLLCGLCVLHSQRGDSSFTITSHALAETNSFSYICGGRGAVFGVNLSCDRVVLLLEPLKTQTEVLVQCLGRCGRTGRFTKSEVLFGSRPLLQKLFNEPSLLSRSTGRAQMDARVALELKARGG